jgi:hypothetical protein
MEQPSTSHFGLYETLRALIPGFYFTCLLYVFLGVFFPHIAQWLDDELGTALAIVFLTLVAGITIYAKEAPKRRKAFVENQPSTYLLNRSRRLSEHSAINDAEAQRLYFYILNTQMPPTVHEKVFFFGTIYTIMINIRRTSLWFGIAFVAALGAAYARGTSVLELPEAFVFGAIAWGVYVLNIRYNKADRKMQENYQDQIFWLKMNDELIVTLLRQQQDGEKE